MTTEPGRVAQGLDTMPRDATGAQLEVEVASRRGAGPRMMTPDERSAAVIDVLLLADAIPRRRPAERRPNWPRMDSTGHRG